jgi:type I restriction enzyme S subunit
MQTNRELQMENRQNLPAGWKWVKLGEVCESSSGVWGEEPDSNSICYPVLRSNNIRDGKIILDDIALRKVEAKYIESKALKYGDILVTTSSGSEDLLGKSAIFIPTNDKVYLFSNFTMRLRPLPTLIDNFYCYFYLQSPDAKKVLQLLQATTTGLRNLNRKEFLNQTIPLPPLSEQKRIAAKLKEIMNEVDNARTACEKQLEAAKALPSAYLREVFESPEARNWPQKKLGEVCETTSGGTPNRGILDYFTGGIIWIKSGELNDNIVYNGEEKITEDAIKNSSAKIMPVGTVLVAMYGATVGKLGVLGVEAATNQAICSIIPKSDILNYYLFFFLLYHRKSLLEERFGGAQPNISQQVIRNILLPTPPLSEQKRIAEYLKEKITQVEKLQAAIEKELATINSLPQSILSKAFKGEL